MVQPPRQTTERTCASTADRLSFFRARSASLTSMPFDGVGRVLVSVAASSGGGGGAAAAVEEGMAVEDVYGSWADEFTSGRSSTLVSPRAILDHSASQSVEPFGGVRLVRGVGS